MRRAKIVCTLGPATASPEKIQQLVDAGMDVARINRSHGEPEEHAAVIELVRNAAEVSGRAVAILVDLQGPKIRLERFVVGKHDLAVGDVFTITTRDVPGTKELVGTTYKGLPGDCSPGDLLLIDDGKVTVRVTAVTDTDVVTECVVPGPVSNNKGINLPGVAVSVPAMSDKDEEDLRWALALRADFIALSFVRSAKDYDDVSKIMDEEGYRAPVIAKIEKPQAVANLAEIIDAFDGIMVARGDLGVELPLERVPLVQKDAVAMARRMAKPVIVATQVLESMITSPRPTRAETSDCANAVLDGADAVMLSGETSVGDFPIECVETMARIIEATEEHGLERIAAFTWTPHTRGGVITAAANQIGKTLEAKYLVTFTQTGDSARRMSRLRSELPLIAFTPDPRTRRQLALSWGVQTIVTPTVPHTDAMIAAVDASLQEGGYVVPGDRVVVVSGAPVGRAGTTNLVQVHRIGDDGDRHAPTA